MVFCFQNCSDLLWEKKCSTDQQIPCLQPWISKESLEQSIQTVKG